jgi:hypothetical protein
MSKEAGDLVITIFASPAPMAARLIDMSVVVQQHNGLEPVLDADIFLVLRDPSTGLEFQAQAIRSKDRNKPVYESSLMFPRSGKWDMTITIQRNGQITGMDGTVTVAPAPSKAVSYAGYLAFPPAMIVLFAIRERLLRRTSRRYTKVPEANDARLS